jgi:hypothetical protein
MADWKHVTAALKLALPRVYVTHSAYIDRHCVFLRAPVGGDEVLIVQSVLEMYGLRAQFGTSASFFMWFVP